MKKNQWLLYLILLAAVFIIAATILRLLTPPKKELNKTEFMSTNKLGNQSQLKNISFTGTTPTIPQKFSLAQAQKETNLPDFETELTQKLKLQLSPNSMTDWVNDDYSLSKDDFNHLYILSKNDLQLSQNPIDQDQAMQAAQDFLKNNLTQFNLTVVKDAMQNLTGEIHYQETTADHAQLLLIPFAYQIDNYPVFYQHQEGYPIEIIVTNQYQVQKLIFQPLFLNFTVIDQLDSIPIEEAIKNINQNIASIIYTEQQYHGDLAIEEISSGELASVSLEYRYDEASSLVYPFYRFKGQIINKAGQKIIAEIITPAVPVKINN